MCAAIENLNLNNAVAGRQAGGISSAGPRPVRKHLNPDSFVARKTYVSFSFGGGGGGGSAVEVSRCVVGSSRYAAIEIEDIVYVLCGGGRTVRSSSRVQCPGIGAGSQRLSVGSRIGGGNERAVLSAVCRP